MLHYMSVIDFLNIMGLRAFPSQSTPCCQYVSDILRLETILYLGASLSIVSNLYTHAMLVEFTIFILHKILKFKHIFFLVPFFLWQWRVYTVPPCDNQTVNKSHLIGIQLEFFFFKLQHLVFHLDNTFLFFFLIFVLLNTSKLCSFQISPLTYLPACLLCARQCSKNFICHYTLHK